MNSWKLLIPIYGRYLYYKSTEGKRPFKKRIFTLLENTLFYFITGVLGAFALPLPYDFLIVMAPALLIIIPIEYVLIKLKPHWFLWEGEVSFAPFIWIIYHCSSSLLLGYGVGLVIT